MVGSIAAADLWYQIGFTAGEMKNPVRDTPQTMLFGTLIVAALYFFANVVYLNILRASDIAGAAQDRVGTAALQAVFGPAGLYVMAAAIAISCFGCNNALILSVARVYYEMALDGLFSPRRPCSTLDTVHRAWPSSRSRRGAAYFASPAPTPNFWNTWYSRRCSSIKVLTACALFALRFRHADLVRPIRAIGHPWLPGFFLLLTAALSVNLLIQKPQYTWPGLIIIGLGIPMFVFRPHPGSAT